METRKAAICSVCDALIPVGAVLQTDTETRLTKCLTCSDLEQPGRRLDNYGGSDTLIGELVKRIDAAEQRAWLTTMIFDAEAGKEIVAALQRARERDCDVRVLMRNERSCQKALISLRGGNIEVRTHPHVHIKELLTESVHIVHSMNFTKKEMGVNPNAGWVHADAATLKLAEEAFLRLWEDELEPVPGPETYLDLAKSSIPAEWHRYLPHDRLNPLQAKVTPVILESRRHALVGAPTGSGKTMIGMLALLKNLKEDTRRKGVYLVPSRALADEITGQFQPWVRLGVKVVKVTGGDMPDGDLRDADIIITTVEKLESLWRSRRMRETIENLGLIVVDELHLIGEPERGPVLEAIMARLRLISDSTRIVGLSATATNIEELANWLHATPVVTSWKPTKVTHQILGCEDTLKERIRVIQGLVTDARSQGQVTLVFAGARWEAEAIAASIAGVTREQGSSVDQGLLARKRIGYFYRGAPGGQEALKAFKERQLDVLVSTTAIAAGVNTPADLVIVASTKVGVSELSVVDAAQMFGRAGRLGQGGSGIGSAILLARPGEVPAWRQKIAEGVPIRSRMRKDPSDVILGEVLLGRISTRTGAKEWYTSTLAAYESNLDERSVEGSLDLLGHLDLIAEVDGRIMCTRSGRTAGRLLLPVALVKAWKETIPLAVPGSSIIDLEKDLLRRAAQTLGEGNGNEYLNEDLDAALGIMQVKAPYSTRAGKLAALGVNAGLHGRGDTAVSTSGVSLNLMRELWERAARLLTWASGLEEENLDPCLPLLLKDMAGRFELRPIMRLPVGSGPLSWILGNLQRTGQLRHGVADTLRVLTERGLPYNAEGLRQLGYEIEKLQLYLQTAITPEGIAVTFKEGAPSGSLTLQASTERGETRVNLPDWAGEKVILALPPGAGLDGTLIEVVLRHRGGFMYETRLLDLSGLPSLIEEELEFASKLETNRKPLKVRGWRNRRIRKRMSRLESLIPAELGNLGKLLSLGALNANDALMLASFRLQEQLEAAPGTLHPRKLDRILESGSATREEYTIILKHALDARWDIAVGVAPELGACPWAEESKVSPLTFTRTMALEMLTGSRTEIYPLLYSKPRLVPDPQWGRLRELEPQPVHTRRRLTSLQAARRNAETETGSSTPSVAFGDNLLKETVAYTAVDVETTGFGVKDRVIAVGLAMFGESGTLLATWSTLINPGRDAGPVQVHGITNEMLKGEYRFEQVAAELSELLSGRLVAHNAAFDKRMLESEYERAGLKLPDWDFTCTMQFAKRTLKGNTSFKLEAVRETLGLPPHKAHSALDDAIAAGEVYAALQERI